MMTSPTMLCLCCVLQCVKLRCHCCIKALHRKLACISEHKAAVGDWYNEKSIQSAAYFWYNSNISKCKQSVFTRYHAPTLTLLASNSLKRYVDANTASDITVPSQMTTLKLIFHPTEIILATGRLIYMVFHKKGPLFCFLIIHSNNDQFAQNLYQL